MLSDDSIKRISFLFCGDTEGFYRYKSGPALVEFFNRYFQSGDVYRQGFPSRWSYVHDKLVDMIDNNSINSFFDIILNRQYIISDLGLTVIEASEKKEEILSEINRIISHDACKLVLKNNHYLIVNENDDLKLIGQGGFANVYRQLSTGVIVKRLKDDYLANRGIRSRFKREFDITMSLQGVHGIIEVYSFDPNDCSYTMEAAETTLENYVSNNTLSDEIKLSCIRQILFIMTEVHKRDIIHRDISPNNIFVLRGMLKIADFGLGKDLNVLTSHQTIHTKAVGQLLYCAPEQFMMLKEADKRSDVFSLGRVINFIMTGDPRDSHHIYGGVAEKATNASPVYRYADAGQLSVFFEKSVVYHKQAENMEAIERKMRSRQFDDDIYNYIHDLTPEGISKAIMDSKPGFQDALLAFMRDSEENAQHIVQSIEGSFREICRTFESHDPFAVFASRVLREGFSFTVNEIAATILSYVAHDVNRFSAQRLAQALIDDGVEPMIEDILERE